MEIIENDSFNVQIWVGLREEYTDIIHSIKDVEIICDEYISKYHDCVSITPTQFRYVNGNEPGVVIGLIKYPRFIRSNEEILNRAFILGEMLKNGLKQIRVSITTPEKTFMLT